MARAAAALAIVLLAALAGVATCDDPRSSLPGRPPRISHARWDPGRQYTYSFSSRAAHIEAALPDPSKVGCRFVCCVLVVAGGEANATEKRAKKLGRNGRSSPS